MSDFKTSELDGITAGAEVMAGETMYRVEYRSWEHNAMFGDPDVWWTCDRSTATPGEAWDLSNERDRRDMGHSYRERRLVAVTEFVVVRPVDAPTVA
jgi:hypothetical protein